GVVNVYRSTDSGTTWQRLSNFPDTTATCRRIAQSVSNPNFIYLTRGTNVWRTQDGGVSWTSLRPTISGPRGNWPLTSVAVSSSDPRKVWVTVNNFYKNGNKVYYSTDAGVTWTNYSGSLPDVPVDTIVYEGGSNDGLYVGMEPGIFYRDASMTDWQPF